MSEALYNRTTKTFWIRIYLSGPINEAKQILRRFCKENHLCVNVQPCDYIYTGGEEAGYVVELVNYPKYPRDEGTIGNLAHCLAAQLMEGTYQDSYMIMDSEDTDWRSVRPPIQEDKKLKEHEVANLVNDLTYLAREVRDTQQLRERIAGSVKGNLRDFIDSPTSRS